VGERRGGWTYLFHQINVAGVDRRRVDLDEDLEITRLRCRFRAYAEEAEVMPLENEERYMYETKQADPIGVTTYSFG
jgi:hypothetical protein